jgi:beta-glucoside operon transcriptional antiterminator
MIIHKVFNNNVVSVLENDKEMVVMGRGLAFKKKPGDPVVKELIEKVFTLENKDVSDRFKVLLNETPLEYMDVSDEIIRYAKDRLGRKLNDSIYVSLTNHIHFAIQRHQKGNDIKNALLSEIKKSYADEFLVGMEALNIIERKLGIILPEDEAGFIALHVVNAE